MKAIDVIRARSQVRDFVYPPEYDAVERRLQEGLRRVQLAMTTTGQKIKEMDTLAVPTVAYLVGDALVEDTSPEDFTVNYYLAGALTETVERIAEAMDDNLDEGTIPPPSKAGFCLLGEPLRWTDIWGKASAANLVTWAPSKSNDGAGFYTITLWTNERTEAVQELMRDWNLRIRQGWQQMTHGWHISRQVMIVPTLECGPPTFEADEETIENFSSDEDPITPGTLIPNFDRFVLALWAVLAGADVPGKDREVEKVVEEPGKDLARTAKKKHVPGAVSFVYAGVHRAPTPPENVGSRGPIGVYYWRNGFTKRVVLDDGTVAIRKRRGTWCGDPQNPVSERTKVRITKGTVARPNDVRTNA
jgi:hypothetical protein